MVLLTYVGYFFFLHFSDYAGSKYAIIGMMEALDSELHHAGKQGIRTTIICPYFINTELDKGFQTQ